MLQPAWDMTARCTGRIIGMFSVYQKAQAGKQDRTGLTATYRQKRGGRAARNVISKEAVI